MKDYYDAPTVRHYDREGTFHRIASRYFPIMLPNIKNYVKTVQIVIAISHQTSLTFENTCVLAANETLSTDLFRQLPESPNEKSAFFIVEECYLLPLRSQPENVQYHC